MFNSSQNQWFLLSHVTFKFDGWHWKTVGQPFYTTSSCVLYFKATGEFKLELQSGNTRFGSKSAMFVSRVTLKFDGWPWKIMGQLFHTISSFVHNFKAIDEFKHTLQSRSAQFGSKSAIICPVWPSNLTEDLENNRASLLYYTKLCTSFQNHWWIESGITVPKRSIRVKIGDFLIIGHILYAASSFLHHFIAICEFKRVLRSRNG